VRLWCGASLIVILSACSKNSAFVGTSPNKSGSNAIGEKARLNAKSPFEKRKSFLSLESALANKERGGLNLGSDDQKGVILKSGSAVVAIVRGKCVVEQLKKKGGAEFSNRYLAEEEPRSRLQPDLEQTALLLTLRQDTPLPVFEDLAAKDACVVGVSQRVEARVSGATLNDPLLTQQTALERMNYAYAWEELVPNLAGTTVDVALVDSGFDIENNTDGVPFGARMEGTNVHSSGSRPQDELGHGTMLGHIIAARSNNGVGIAGIGSNVVNLVPIKVVNPKGLISNVDVMNGIERAVNAGARVINLSLGGEFSGCDPIVGHVISRAIEKRVFVVMSAGNGKLVQSTGKALGYRLVGARADGTTSYAETVSPACWGPYFRGAVTVGALKEKSDQVADFSNYGDAVELAAPGENIVTLGLRGARVQTSGTSAAAAQVSAAAALIIAKHESRGWWYDPWLVEDILINSAKKVPSLASDDRSIFQGNTLNLASLAQRLIALEKKSKEERRQEASTDRRDGDGWKPGVGADQDVSPLEKVVISPAQVLVVPGNSVKLTAQAIYRDGKTVDVTEKAVWSFLDSPGVTARGNAVDVAASADLKNIPFVVQYGGVISSGNVSVVSKPPEDNTYISMELDIADPKNPVVWGSNGITFKVTGIRKEGAKEIHDDLTSKTKFISDVPGELKPTASMGLFSTIAAFGGKTYTITAEVLGRTLNKQISVPLAPLTEFKIDNPVGDSFTTGQKVPYFAKYTSSGPTGGEFINVTWLLNGTEVAADTYTYVVDTSKLTAGSHSLQVTGVYRGAGTSQSLNQTVRFSVGRKYDRIQVFTDTPVLNVSARGQFVVRAYFPNNSYEVVSAQAQWTSSDPKLMPVDSAGRVFPVPESVGKQFDVKARFLDMESSASIKIVSGSAVTGSGNLESISITPGSITAGWNQLWNVGKFTATALYDDGTTRDVTEFASWSSNQPGYNFSAPAGRLSLAFDAYCPRSAQNVEVYAIYEGKKATANVLSQTQFLAAGGYVGSLESSPGTFVRYGTFAAGTTAKRPLKHDYDLQWYSGSQIIPSKYLTYKLIRMSDGVDVSNVIAASSLNSVKVNASRLDAGLYKLRVQSSFCTQDGNPHESEAMMELTARTAVSIAINARDLQWKSGYVLTDVSTQVKYDDGTEEKGVRSDVDVSVVSVNGQANPGSTWITNTGLAAGGDLWDLSPGLDNTIVLKAVHKASGVQATKSLRKIGVQNLPFRVTEDYPTVPRLIPKQDDAYCTTDRRAARPYAGGTGTSSDPIIICSADQFLSFNGATANNKTWYVELRANVDFSRHTNLGRNVIGKVVPWRSLRLQGNGYEVQNMHLLDADADNVGFFAELRNSALEDITFRNASLRGRYNVGVVSGVVHTSFLSNIHIVDSLSWAKASVGGMFGVVNASTLVDSGAQNIAVKVESNSGGGLAGGFYHGRGWSRWFADEADPRQSSGAFASRLYATGRVEGNGTSMHYSGGLFGIAGSGSDSTYDALLTLNAARGTLETFLASETNTTVIVNSFADVDVTSAVNAASLGGLAGESTAILINTMALGDVVSGGTATGGLVGQLGGWGHCQQPRSAILNSWAKGSVIGNISSGGLAGEVTCGIIEDSGAMGTTRGVTNTGGLIGTSRLQSIVRRSTAQGPVSSSGANRGGVIGLKTSQYSSSNTDTPGFIDDIYSGVTFSPSKTGQNAGVGRLRDAMSQTPVGMAAQ
jgi:hypothetical protein